MIEMPIREQKPRSKGLNILIDNGYPERYFKDVVDSMDSQIDFIKFGWGTSIVTRSLKRKIDILADHDIRYFFGGTLFEKFLYQGKISEYRYFLDKYNCEYMEVSNGTIDLSNSEKCTHIREFSEHYQVFSEVGLKDSKKSEEMIPKKWIECISEDIHAGAIKVITEARESGNSGICRSNGDIRIGLFEEIMDSNLDVDNIVFEAPNKKLQAYFINRLGANCNLANIAFADVIRLETLRLGICSDTFFTFEDKKGWY